MHILIEKDGETEHREVVDLAEAQALADAGNTVLVPNSDGGHRQLEASGDAPAAPVEEAVTKQVPIKAAAPKPPAKKAPAKKAAAKVPAKKSAKAKK